MPPANNNNMPQGISVAVFQSNNLSDLIALLLTVLPLGTKNITTTPNKDCAEIHNRMPVLIKPSELALWFNASPEQLSPLMMATENSNIAIEKVISVAGINDNYDFIDEQSGHPLTSLALLFRQ